MNCNIQTKAEFNEDCRPVGDFAALFRSGLFQTVFACTAIDPEFRTIDFLTLVDLHHIPDRLRTRFF